MFGDGLNGDARRQLVWKVERPGGDAAERHAAQSLARRQVEALTRQQEANATEMNRLQKENILLREARQGAAPPRRQ